MTEKYPMFKWSPGNLIDDGDDFDNEDKDDIDKNENHYLLQEADNEELFDKDN